MKHTPQTAQNQNVRAMQQMLRVISKAEPSAPGVIPDGIYGTSTARAVNQFQRNHCLPQTGVADEQTYEAITKAYEDACIQVGPADPLCIVLNPGETISEGQSDPIVYLLQGVLTILSESLCSIPAPGLTGKMDMATMESLRRFQELCDLPQTGVLDRITWHNLAVHFPSVCIHCRNE